MSDTTIKLRRSAVPSKVPTTEQLALGEIALNTYDGKIFIKKDDGVESVISIGERGFTGSQGDIGFTGSQGVTGFVGSQGIQGFTGSQGIIGYTGSQGDIGYTGSQGIQGEQGVTGFTGSQGIQGIQGFTGSQGIQGDIGYTGSRGNTGFTGSQGEIGFTGSQGDTGFVGSQGFTGSMGPVAGTDGQIIYNNGGVAGGANVYYDDTNDRFGIGVASPTSKLDIAETWNDVATTFTGVKLNVTDTTSAAGSLLMDLRVGGSSRFRVNKSGSIIVPAGTNANPGIKFVSDGDTGFKGVTSGGGEGFSFIIPTATPALSFNWALGLRVTATNFIGFSNNNNSSEATVDVRLYRDAANTLAQRNGTSAQTSRTYNTFTDASNYERAKIGWNTNVLEIGSEAAGTGTLRNINIVGGNVGINTASASAKLDVVGDIEVNSNVNLNSEATTLATTTKTQIASFAVASFRSAKLIVQAYDSVTGEVHISELLVAHNGTTASSTEYGVVFTGANPLAVYDVDISSGNVRLLAQRTSANSTQYKVSETLMVA
jgi:hypothetical protein